MKLMSVLMMTLMAGVLFNNTAIAGVQYDINAKLYRDGQDISDLFEPYITVDDFVEGVAAYLDTVGNYRLVSTSSGQGSVCVDMPS